MIVKEFSPVFLHVKGEKSVAADAPSRLDMSNNAKDSLDDEESSTQNQTCATVHDVEDEAFPMAPSSI